MKRCSLHNDLKVGGETDGRTVVQIMVQHWMCQELWCKSMIQWSLAPPYTPEGRKDNMRSWYGNLFHHDDAIKWKHFPSYWPFVRGIHRSVTRSFAVFVHLRLNIRLSKQWWGWWFETPSRSLWHHCKMTLLILCGGIHRPQVHSPPKDRYFGTHSVFFSW